MSTTTASEILGANDLPADYAERVERAGALLDRHGEVELLRLIAGVLEARGLQFAADQVRRAIARVEQGS